MSPDDRRPAITPQLAVRVAILGGIALTAFAIIFFRLWFLQVLSGEDYVSQARENRTRTVRIQAPRGEVVDRNGRILVDNRPSNVVQLEPQELPEETIEAAATWGQRVTQTTRRDNAAIRAADRRVRRLRGDRRQDALEARRELRDARPAAERVQIPPIGSPALRARYAKLGEVLGMRPRTIHRRVIEQLAVLPYSAVTVRSDVPRSVLAYLEENRRRYPGVAVEQVYLRRYPRDTLAAQLLGNVGQISREELKLRRNRDVNQGTVIGKAGIEYTYDRYLRGRDGARSCASTPTARSAASCRAAASRSPAGSCASRSTPACRRRARRPSRRSAAASPARSWRWTRAAARSARSARCPASTPRSSRSRSRRRRSTR